MVKRWQEKAKGECQCVTYPEREDPLSSQVSLCDKKTEVLDKIRLVLH